jgi:hypothetical protein
MPLTRFSAGATLLTPQIGYASLEPTLRLVSRLLRSEAATRLFHIMLNHGPQKRKGRDKLMKRGLQEYANDKCRDHNLSATSRRGVDAALAELQYSVSFSVKKSQSWSDAHMDPTKVRARYLRTTGIGTPRAKYRLKKEPSVITFGRKLYDDLVIEEGRQPQDMDLSRLLTLRFHLAVMLTHEVVHALR